MQAKLVLLIPDLQTALPGSTTSAQYRKQQRSLSTAVARLLHKTLPHTQQNTNTLNIPRTKTAMGENKNIKAAVAKESNSFPK